VRKTCAAIVMLLLSVQTAASEDLTGPNWQELRPDSKVSMQILCGLGALRFIQEIVAQCQLPKTPMDNARERAIGRLEDFVIANSTQRPQTEMFEEMRRVFKEKINKSHYRLLCSQPDLIWLHNGDPVKLDASVEEMLTKPFNPNQRNRCGW